MQAVPANAPISVLFSQEWWAYEVVIIQAGWLPGAEVALSVMGICLNIVVRDDACFATCF